MAFKIIALFAVLVCTNARYIEINQHQTHYSSVPTVSYSLIREPHVPKVAVSKTPSYAEPAVHYAAPVTKTVSFAEPAVHYAAPVTKTVTYAAPAVQYAAPVTKTYTAHEPSLVSTFVQQPTYGKTPISEPVYTYAAPVVHDNTHAYPSQYAYSSPAVKNFKYSKSLSFAPVGKTFVSQSPYTKAYGSEPTYTKAYVSGPAYAKTLVSEPSYAHAAPVYAGKSLSFPHGAQVSHGNYEEQSAHHAW